MIRVILPNQYVLPQEMVDELHSEMQRIAALMSVDLQEPASTWAERVEFVIDRPDPWSVRVYTENAIYNWVNDGTALHDIPITPHALRFFTGGTPKTQPMSLSAGSGSIGTTEVIRGHVQQSITARHFDEVVATKWESQIDDLLQIVVDRTAPQA